MLEKINWKSFGLFVSGVVFGTVGLKALSSKDAKKFYSHMTAAALRAKDYTIKRTEILRENVEDIYEEAKDINELRNSKEEVVYDNKDDDYEEVKTEE